MKAKYFLRLVPLLFLVGGAGFLVGALRNLGQNDILGAAIFGLTAILAISLGLGSYARLRKKASLA